ncbi:MAG: M48 family metallopeptidase [Castellaniella sp.]|uniref:M48 family metallopeptidase n=1 Tax=Castellaniella sp. TaxID=1955812 RepID=UPI003A85C843
MPTADRHQLDLFSTDDWPTAAPASRPGQAGDAAPTPRPERPPSPLHAPSKPAHPAAKPLLPPAPPTDLPPGARWRTLELDGGMLGYVLRRVRRKTIGLHIQDTGLTIRAPAWATYTQIEDAIREKAAWIQDKIQDRDRRLEQLALQAGQWRPGGRIPYLGIAVELRLDGARPVRYAGDPGSPAEGDCLFLPLPDSADPGRIQERAQAWLQERARIDFDRRLRHCLARARQSILGWSLSSAQGRWGSCNSQKRIRLNWRLIHFAPALIDYVVAHEIAHLKEMNHSPAFWREVERLCPDFREARDTLRRQPPDTLPLI